MAKKPTSKSKRSAARRSVRDVVGVRLSEIRDTLENHPWNHECPACGKDCGRIACVKLVRVDEPCDCAAANYTHLVERIYHVECFLAKHFNDPAHRPAREQE